MGVREQVKGGVSVQTPHAGPIYQVPLALFFKAIGASDAEFCGHGVTKEQERLAVLMKDQRIAQGHTLLQNSSSVIKVGAKAAVTILETVAGDVGRKKKAF